jgi:hypothetical protein
MPRARWPRRIGGAAASVNAADIEQGAFHRCLIALHGWRWRRPSTGFPEEKR